MQMYEPQSLVVVIILSEKPRENKLLVFLHDKTRLHTIWKEILCSAK